MQLWHFIPITLKSKRLNRTYCTCNDMHLKSCKSLQKKHLLNDKIDTFMQHTTVILHIGLQPNPSVFNREAFRNRKNAVMEVEKVAL